MIILVTILSVIILTCMFAIYNLMKKLKYIQLILNNRMKIWNKFNQLSQQIDQQYTFYNQDKIDKLMKTLLQLTKDVNQQLK